MSTQLDGSTAVDARRGNWIQTFSGRRFYVNSPESCDVCIEDVAHALSNICRFTGHVRRFYSVAEHCVRVSYLTDPRHALWGLLHDAPEAYIGDVSRPLKHAPGMEGYADIELLVEAAVVGAFGIDLTPEMLHDVKTADLHMLCVEARLLLGVADFAAAGWRYWTEPSPDIELGCWTPEHARTAFMARYRQLA